MRLATSYFKPSYFIPSWALFRENLKRFWAVPALGMLCWFFAGIFPILVDENENLRQWLRMASEMRHPGFIIFTPIFPLMASAAALRYLFSPGAVAAMHKLPLTRGRLYCTSFVFSSAASLAPAAVTYLVLALAGAGEGYGMLPAFAMTLLLTLFYTALFHVAAMLTGNSVMHLGACAFLSFALPALVLLVGVYCQTLLFGYDGSASLELFAARSVPLLYFIDDGWRSAGWLASYILAVPALYAAGAALYARRPLERAGDSIVFPFFETIFTFVIAFAGMTLLSALFDAAGWGYFPLNLGLVLGAAVCFLMARMVSKKSLRVFNKSTLAHGGAYAVAAALLLGVLSFDLVGYEPRVPSPERVLSAHLSRSFIPQLSHRYIYGYKTSYNDAFAFTEPENINAMTELHRSITELRDSDIYEYNGINGLSTRGYVQTYVSLWYDTDSGTLSRRYNVPNEHLMNDANARMLFESEEFKAQNDLRNPDLGQPIGITLRSTGNFNIYSEEPQYYESAGVITLSSDEYAELLGALSADMRDETWEQLTADPFYCVTVSIDYTSEYTVESDVSLEVAAYHRSSGYANISVPPHYTRTVAWLSSRGYFGRLTAWQEDISSARLTRYVLHKVDNGMWYESSETDSFETTDAERIRLALDGANGQHIQTQTVSEYWAMEIFVRGNASEPYIIAYFPADSPIPGQLK